MIHVVYTHGPRGGCPWDIGNGLIAQLSLLDDVSAYPWDETLVINPAPEDVLVGQPGPHDRCVWQASAPRFEHAIMVAPWNGSPNDQRYLREHIDVASSVMLFAGPYWRKFLPIEYRSKTQFLGLATSLPFVKPTFAPVGQRRILYVGCCQPVKGGWYLEEIISLMPGVHFGHAGYGTIRGAVNHGYIDHRELPHLAREYDFTINCGVHDANPTTVIEAAAMGLIPLATPQCGWDEPATHFPYGQSLSAVDIISDLLYSNESRLIRLQNDNRKFAE